MEPLMDRPVRGKARALILLALALLPAAYVARQYDPQTKLTSLLCLGPAFESRSLPEVRALPHALAGTHGYDGQFYAQVALSPALRHPGLSDAMDNPAYRARRILMPATAYALGLGRPAWVLLAYALINPLCLLLLLAALVHYLKPATVRHFLCIAAITWTAGALVSVQRSLTDLPASLLLFMAAAATAGGLWGVAALAAAALTRDISLLGLPAVIWPDTWRPQPMAKAALRAVLALVPLAGWLWYVSRMMPARGPGATLAIDWPLVGLGHHLLATAQAFVAHPRISLVFELLAPLSLCAQALYLFLRPQPGSRFWRLGVVFGILFFFLSVPSMEEQVSYARVTLPLTIAFNVLLLQDPQGRRFPLWIAAGNVGLLFPALQMLREIIRF